MKKFNRTSRLALSLCLILALTLLLSACAAAKSDGMVANDAYADMELAPMEPSKSESLKGDYGYVTDSYYAGSSNEYIGAPGEVSTSVPDASQMSEKIIRTVTIDAQTKEYDKAVAEIRSAVTLVGGFEESFRSTGRSYYYNGVYSRSAYMVLRLPAGELDAFLSKVGGLVNVLSQSSNAQNVTSEYYDIQTRIGVLESERDAYEEMLKQSMDINYLLQVKDRLYDVIAEIESYQTRLNLLDSKVSYSTVSINLDEVVEYTPVITEEPTFGERVGEAFRESWKSFAEGCQNFAIWFVYAVPTILILSAIAAAVIVVAVKLRRKRKHPAPQKEESDAVPSDK